MTAPVDDLLARYDRMSESTLVRLSDWEMARLRAVLLQSLEDRLNATVHEQARGANPAHPELTGPSDSEDER